MRCLERNKALFYYNLFGDKEPVLDENGFETGEYRLVYKSPVAARASISAAQGETQAELFGNDIQYDKVIITDDIDCPIDEATVLFVDKTPAFDTNGIPLFDYRVKKVAKSLNYIAIAISKVNTAQEAGFNG